MAIETRLSGKGDERRNITLSLPRALIKEAKIRAASRDLSLSAFLRKSLERAIVEDSDYEEAKARALKNMEKGFNLGLKDRIPWTRDELHDRKL